jgi:hypothetical protein
VFFFFIIGFGKTTADYIGSAGIRSCPRCGRRAEWGTYRVRTWCTLFFIPLFPYKTVTVDVCPVCRYGADPSTDLPAPPGALPGPPAWGA